MSSAAVEGPGGPAGGWNQDSPEFKSVGLELFTILKPQGRVLDVGCGTGRLLQFIPDGVGLEVNHKAADACTSKFGNRVDLMDVYNPEFNEDGSVDPLEAAFPRPSGQHSFLTMCALFNHFMPAWIDRYLAEAARVTMKGGTVAFTCLCANARSEAFFKYRMVRPFSFKHRVEHGYVDDAERPCRNSAVDESFLRASLIRNGLQIRGPIRYGAWSRHPGAVTGHDVVVAVKV